MRQLLKVGVAIAIGLAAGAVQAQQKPEDAIKYRKAAMTLVGAHFGGQIGAVIRGQAPYNKDAVVQNATLLENITKAPQVWAAFAVAGSDQGDTKLKPEGLKEGDKFREYGQKMAMEIASLNKVAQAGNLDDIKKQFGAVGQACKTCHDAYRKQ